MVIDEKGNCRAVPVNRPSNFDYDRMVRPLDVCVSPEDWEKIQNKISKIKGAQ